MGVASSTGCTSVLEAAANIGRCESKERNHHECIHVATSKSVSTYADILGITKLGNLALRLVNLAHSGARTYGAARPLA